VPLGDNTESGASEATTVMHLGDHLSDWLKVRFLRIQQFPTLARLVFGLANEMKAISLRNP